MVVLSLHAGLFIHVLTANSEVEKMNIKANTPSGMSELKPEELIVVSGGNLSLLRLLGNPVNKNITKGNTPVDSGFVQWPRWPLGGCIRGRV
jgi:hypothetical protein